MGDLGDRSSASQLELSGVFRVLFLLSTLLSASISFLGRKVIDWLGHFMSLLRSR